MQIITSSLNYVQWHLLKYKDRKECFKDRTFITKHTHKCSVSICKIVVHVEFWKVQ